MPRTVHSGRPSRAAISRSVKRSRARLHARLALGIHHDELAFIATEAVWRSHRGSRRSERISEADVGAP